MGKECQASTLDSLSLGGESLGLRGSPHASGQVTDAGAVLMAAPIMIFHGAGQRDGFVIIHVITIA